MSGGGGMCYFFLKHKSCPIELSFRGCNYRDLSEILALFFLCWITLWMSGRADNRSPNCFLELVKAPRASVASVRGFFSPFTGFHTPNDFFFFFLKKVRNNLKLPSSELILLSLTWFISSLVFVYSEYQLRFAKRLLKFGEPLWEFFFWACNNKTRNTAAKVCQRSAWISLLSEKVQAK